MKWAIYMPRLRRPVVGHFSSSSSRGRNGDAVCQLSSDWYSASDLHNELQLWISYANTKRKPTGRSADRCHCWPIQPSRESKKCGNATGIANQGYGLASGNENRVLNAFAGIMQHVNSPGGTLFLGSSASWVLARNSNHRFMQQARTNNSKRRSLSWVGWEFVHSWLWNIGILEASWKHPVLGRESHSLISAYVLRFVHLFVYRGNDYKWLSPGIESGYFEQIFWSTLVYIFFWMKSLKIFAKEQRSQTTNNK